MTRRDHRGRFTAGSIAMPRETGAPLFCVHTKSAAHVRGHQTRKARQRAKVWAVAAKLRQECGL